MRDTLSLLQLLQVHRRGALLELAEERLSEVLDAMNTFGGDGEITIKIPLKRNKSGQIEALPKVTSKKPEKQLGTGLYYITDDGKLSQRDPEQFDIEDEVSARRATANMEV